MAWFRKRRGAEPTQQVRSADRGDLAHLEQFVQSRIGVEAYIEPRTMVTETTVMLIAHDGEWTRRRIDGPQGARRFAQKVNIPVYDVALMGYPKRMRDYNERQKEA